MSFGIASSVLAEDVTISSAAELVAFASRVNAGETSLNATLTANIDLNGTAWTPIGNSTNKYAGTFDGQGYAILNFDYTATSDYNGLFGYISNATVKNFSISGTLTSDGFTKNGVVGCATGTAKVSGIHSSMTVNVLNCKAHTGGIVGGDTGVTTDKIVVDGCEFSGTLTHSGTGDCQAGIMGYTGYSTIRNCIFSGTINGETSRYAGILGYCKQPSFGGVQNCLSIGKITVSSDSSNKGSIIGTWNGNATSNVKNNYYCLKEGSNITRAIGGNTANCEAPHAVTAEELASGEVCYLLNGDQSNIAFYQTLGTDEVPTVDSSRGTVYLAGRTHCDGTPYGGESGYSNTANIQDEHQNVDGFCSNCGAFIEDGLTANTDGYYEIGNATQLKWVATKVNSGDMAINVILTNDIDMSTLTSWTAIGNWGSTPNGSAGFKGHFNGQGHAINNFDFTATHNYFSIFGVISTGALIENFSVNGSISNSGYQYVAGAVAYARDENPTIRNVRSYVNLNSSNTKGRHGGILGGSLDGTVKIDNCSYFGELKVPASGNFGGIVGYVNNSTSAFLDVTDCLFAGGIEYTDGVTSGNSACGGIIGYNNGGFATIKNCLSLGDITTEVRGLIFGQLNGNNSKIYNCYYQGDYANAPASTGTASPMEATAVSDEQLASGEICYLLNESVSGGTEWYQTLPGDSKPTLDNTHELVYVNGTVCPDTGAPQGTVSYGNSEGTIVGNHHFVDGFCSYCDFLDESYMTPIDGNYMIGTPAQLMWFAAFVNAGHQTANAKLANITPLDLTGVAVEPIGNSSAAYTGTFDGQGKSITGFSATSTGNGGLFGNINNATIKDFSISGSLTVNSGTGSGVIGWATNSTISGIHSTLVINVPGNETHHVAGVVGSCQGGNTVSGCSFAGTLTVTGNTRDCFGGVAGYFKNDNMKNCANYGTLSYTKSDGYVGGVAGYINNADAHITNSLAIGTVTYAGEGTPTYGGTLIGRLANHTAANFCNNYWLTGTAPEGRGSGQNTVKANQEVTAEQLASGEIAYKLGEEWGQILGTEDYPALGSTPVSYVGAAGYATMYDATTGYTLNGDVKAYVAVLNETWLKLTDIENIPAGTAVILKGTYYNKTAEDLPAINVANDLQGTEADTPADGTMYILAKVNDEVGFYQATGTIPAGKAYYKGTSSVKVFIFEGDDVTGIKNINPEHNEAIYNMAGQRVHKMQKGIFIVGNKKILYLTQN